MRGYCLLVLWSMNRQEAFIQTCVAGSRALHESVQKYLRQGEQCIEVSEGWDEHETWDRPVEQKPNDRICSRKIKKAMPASNRW